MRPMISHQCVICRIETRHARQTAIGKTYSKALDQWEKLALFMLSCSFRPRLVSTKRLLTPQAFPFTQTLLPVNDVRWYVLVTSGQLRSPNADSRLSPSADGVKSDEL